MSQGYSAVVSQLGNIERFLANIEDDMETLAQEQEVG